MKQKSKASKSAKSRSKSSRISRSVSFTKKLRTRGGMLSLLVTLFAFAAGASVVYAIIPDNNELIHACYRLGGSNGGLLRVIDSPKETCRNGETELTWNQRGPQGPAGPEGSGGGAFIAKRTEVPYTHPNGGVAHSYMIVPGLGDFKAFCGRDEGQSLMQGYFGVEFKNTSGQAVYITGPSGNKLLGNGEIYPRPNNPLNAVDTSYTFVFEDGSKGGSISIEALPPTNNCTVSAFGFFGASVTD